MQIGIIIQARLGSTRLPGKVLLKVGDKPLIERVYSRALKVSKASCVIVATSDNTNDDHLYNMCVKKNMQVFRGNESDVLDRYYKAAQAFQLEAIIRVTGDCPLIDPFQIDKLIDTFLAESWDYVSNSQPLRLPHGLEASIMSFSALEKSWREAVLLSEREHVTQYIRKHPELFKTNALLYPEDYSHYRLTVDYPEDLTLVNAVYRILDERNWFGTYQEVVQILKEFPELPLINAQYKVGEGLAKSLQNDRVINSSPENS